MKSRIAKLSTISFLLVGSLLTSSCSLLGGSSPKRVHIKCQFSGPHFQRSNYAANGVVIDRKCSTSEGKDQSGSFVYEADFLNKTSTDKKISIQLVTPKSNNFWVRVIPSGGQMNLKFHEISKRKLDQYMIVVENAD